MNGKTAFWDASAIVELCVAGARTSSLRRLTREYPALVAWWGTPLEVRSALARLVRDCVLTEAKAAASLARLMALREGWNEMLPTESLRALAEELPARYGIRAADALQLAAALTWCGGRAHNRRFVCLDKQLSAAARQAGFTLST